MCKVIIISRNRFERNMKPDWELESSAIWTNTDQILIRPTSTESYDFYIDDIIFSNSRTITHNVSSGKRQYMSDSNDQPEDTWYHFDHLGNVANLSDSSGDETTEFIQDAFGNVLSSTTTGAWASSVSGRHLTTKEYDGQAEMYYFWHRWYDPKIGRFLSKAPMPVIIEHPYNYVMNNPINRSDATGRISAAALGCAAGVSGALTAEIVNGGIELSPEGIAHLTASLTCGCAEGAAVAGIVIAADIVIQPGLIIGGSLLSAEALHELVLLGQVGAVGSAGTLIACLHRSCASALAAAGAAYGEAFYHGLDWWGDYFGDYRLL
jgi:RHS repeat-associated protein